MATTNANPTNTNPSMHTGPASDNGINIVEWFIIVAVLIVAAIGYAYYYSAHKTAGQPAANEPVASDTLNKSATETAPNMEMSPNTAAPQSQAGR